MYLTPEQERMLKGEEGWAAAKALEILVKVGEALGAEELVEVKHAHISGVSYSNIGEYGLEFIRELFERGGRARVFTTINPGCLDYSGLSKLIDNSYKDRQAVIDSSLISMGFRPIFTCIPYYYRAPAPREHLSWGESSAVIFANSIFGAFTNREGGPIALASAITGYTYKAGLHFLDNRRARVLVEVPASLSDAPLGAVGLFIGEATRDIPLIDFRYGPPPIWDIKVLLASMAASGSHALAVIPGVTPRGTYVIDIVEKVTIERGEVEKYMGRDPRRDEEVLGYVGCPHLHLFELRMIARILRRYGKPRRGRLLLTIPPELAAKHSELVQFLVSKGVDIGAGTCPVVSRLRSRYDIVVTNSGKAAFYLRRIHGLEVSVRNLREVVEAVYS